MNHEARTSLDRWVAEGLIDPVTAERILAYERANRGRRAGLRWPAWLALGLGTVALGAGILLFVSAHWDELAPASRFGLVLGLVAVFHLGGALAAHRWPPAAVALHALGTVALGGAIFLTAQIFHLREHWPTGLLLWAAGAWAGWLLLRHWPQAGLAAVLTPAWLAGEWAATAPESSTAVVLLVAGLLLLALVYLGAVRGPEERGAVRRALVWIGGLAAIPLALALSIAAHEAWWDAARLPPGLRAVGWAAAIGLPLALAARLRPAGLAPIVAAAAWVALGAWLDRGTGAARYAWGALGAVGLVAWGIREGRAERVNLGAAGFALTVLLFYFSQVMDRLGRSLSLVGLGLILLAGGWALERARRRLVARAREEA